MTEPKSFDIRAIAGGTLLALAGCQSTGGGPMLTQTSASTPVAALTAVNENAQACWFRKGKAPFDDLAMVPELDTMTGNPRLLVVGRGHAGSLPKLVIEASGNPVRIRTYGPLTSHSGSGWMNEDIVGWANSRKGC